jgi:hypothetical protein
MNDAEIVSLKFNTTRLALWIQGNRLALFRIGLMAFWPRKSMELSVAITNVTLKVSKKELENAK